MVTVPFLQDNNLFRKVLWRIEVILGVPSKEEIVHWRRADGTEAWERIDPCVLRALEHVVPKLMASVFSDSVISFDGGKQTLPCSSQTLPRDFAKTVYSPKTWLP